MSLIDREGGRGEVNNGVSEVSRRTVPRWKSGVNWKATLEKDARTPTPGEVEAQSAARQILPR